MPRTNKIHEGDLVAMPGVVYDVEIIEGGLDANGADTKTAFPKLTSVGGSLYANGADTKTAFPKLTSVGGYLDASGAYTKTAFRKDVKWNNPETIQKCKSLLRASFASSGYSFADGILARIVSKRGNVQKVIICGKTRPSYVVTDGESFSHGDTIKEARDGLIYKIGNRDKSEFEGWTLERMVSKRDAIRAYRTITGACEAGVRDWMSKRKTPSRLKVRDVIELTVGAYGNGEFAAFFRGVK